MKSRRSAMKPRERVLAALNHQEPDRVPIDIGSSMTTAMHIRPYSEVVRLLGIDEKVEVYDIMGQLARPSDAVLEQLGADIRGVRVGGTPYHQEVIDDRTIRDHWGTLWKRPEGSAIYNIASHPLAEASSTADLARFNWPDPATPSGAPEHARARELHAEGRFGVIGEISGHILERAQMLRGFDVFLLDLALRPDFAEALMDRIMAIEIGIIDAFLGDVGPYIDAFLFKDDLGTQNGPLISPEMFRRFLKPRIAQIVEAIRRGTDAKIVFHSCGAVAFAIPDLIEIGIDVLNPVQVSARGMDSAALKAEYGSRIAFWGAVDNQSVLPSGTPEEVDAEVKHRIADLAPGGGYVLASVHNMMADVSGENILAMARAAQQYGAYPIKDAT